ncbi:aldehyde dehydrogenase family protein [Streptomyces sp. TRM68367]|uniref:aldehyde dehydrogenase family protein n=1 Tax=Streptomyces sp. TRM68367 TaxID=2758415 RepID=UPI00165C2013|nr:aldehyde dehydrogenase family protein [Streptomyces sp. TRM68367]MBC9728552.1 aldehyde dehydrogenase family protein [Streptomyces sp. TRM68367]
MTATVIQDVPKQLHIAGTWQDAESGRTLPVDNPATGEELCPVADATPADGLRAAETAVAAQPAWAATPPRERSEILRRAYEIIISRTEELALLMTLEMGKPLAEARGEVAYAAEFFRWFSEEAVRVDGGMALAPDGRNRIVVTRQPVGPCLLITPWNFPLAMGTRKIGPAVAAGCTMVLKPAPQTPLSTLALASILAEAGLPDGVLTFEDEDEVVAAANDTDWGLVGYVFTRGLDRALRVSERMETGMVGLNTGLVSNPAAPFGGVKQSGLGREGGRVGMDGFLEHKYLAIPTGA